MEIRAYDEDYLSGAQYILGHAADFAIVTLGIAPDTFGNAFAVSDISKQFANGNPKYVAGINGCELARAVLASAGISFPDAEDAMYLDKSPEYWAGWALAFYQWYRNLSFGEILDIVPLSKIINMYHPYHEMDILQFADELDEIRNTPGNPTRLKKMREINGYSQSELAGYSGVPLRQIQLFEQKQRDINKAAAETLLRLSKALNCKMEDLIEL